MAYIDLIHAGIFDPTKVVRGVSVASLLLLTEATMFPRRKRNARAKQIWECSRRAADRGRKRFAKPFKSRAPG
jgi:hypothetical protein